jgi:hypothetical protein
MAAVVIGFNGTDGNPPAYGTNGFGVNHRTEPPGIPKARIPEMPLGISYHGCYLNPREYGDTLRRLLHSIGFQ